MYLTNKEVSKKLHELGIEEESEFVWIVEPLQRPRREGLVLDSFDVWFPTYAIDELVPVLQKLSEIKGWDTSGKYIDGYIETGYFSERGKPILRIAVSQHFINICSLIADGHPEKVDEYLINLLK